MKSKTIKGYVLKTTAYQEDSLLIKVLTSDGLLTINGRHFQKVSNKNRSLGYIFNLCEFNIAFGKGYPFIVNGNIINNGLAILDDLSLYALVSLVNDMIVSNHYQEDIWEQYSNFYHHVLINKVVSTTLLVKDLLNIYGVIPYVDGCYLCNSNLIVGISNEGGLVCSDCLGSNDLIFSKEILKQFRAIIKLGYDHFDYLCDLNIDNKLLGLLVDYYQYHLSCHFKAYDFYKEVSNEK
ncbi:MAG: DNA repair protein RecO [Erysipelotrichaceae bacterium]